MGSRIGFLPTAAISNSLQPKPEAPSRMSQDPLAPEKIVELGSSIATLQIARTLMDGARNDFKIAEKGLSKIESDLKQMQKLAQRASGNISGGQRNKLETQFQKVKDSIENTSRLKNKAGEEILNGKYSKSVQTGSQSGQTQQIQIENSTTESLGVAFTSIQDPLDAEKALRAIDGALKQNQRVQAKVQGLQESLQFEEGSILAQQKAEQHSLDLLTQNPPKKDQVDPYSLQTLMFRNLLYPQGK